MFIFLSLQISVILLFYFGLNVLAENTREEFLAVLKPQVPAA